MGRTLFIVEGEVYEPSVLTYLWPRLVPEYANAEFIYTYRTNIYHLYKTLKKDSDLSLIGLLKERNPNLLPPDADEDTYQEIFLIFDYDGHVNMPQDPPGSGNHLDGDHILAELLNYFDDEYDHGRLFLNYPMVEAIRHLITNPATPSNLITAKCKGPRCPNTDCSERATCPPVRVYKSIANQASPNRSDMTILPQAEWRAIFGHHLCVGAILSSMLLPGSADIAMPLEIFKSQHIHFISRDCPQVAVLSAFPLFFHYYLGGRLALRLNNLP